jgi:hypothetical protein
LEIEPCSGGAATSDEATTCEISHADPPEVIMANISESEMLSPEDAALAAAVATAAAASFSSSPHSSPFIGPERSTKSRGGSIRRGKWTAEEETYVARVIQDFNSGFLNAPAGTTLRSYLSDKLQCDPMRITKKFTGDSCIGKRVFHPVVRSAANASSVDKAQVWIERNTAIEDSASGTRQYSHVAHFVYVSLDRRNWKCWRGDGADALKCNSANTRRRQPPLRQPQTLEAEDLLRCRESPLPYWELKERLPTANFNKRRWPKLHPGWIGQMLSSGDRK